MRERTVSKKHDDAPAWIGARAIWLNPRWQRMLWWMLRVKSPSHDGRVPTLREAWIGMVEYP